MDEILRSVGSEWELEQGFFWKLRQGIYEADSFRRCIAKLAAIPTLSDRVFSTRLVSLLWYIPLFMEWQRARIAIHDLDQYNRATGVMLSEIERILGVP